MEELEIYQLPDGQRVDITNWPDDYKFIWLAENSEAEAVEPKGDEIALDTSIFGIPGGITPESEIGSDMYGPSLPQGYQDFDLTEMTNQLFSRDIEKYDKKMGGFDSDEKFNTKLNLSLEDIKREDVKDAVIKNYIDLQKNIFGEFDERIPGLEGELASGTDSYSQEDRDSAVYGKIDRQTFINQPSIKLALEEGMITVGDLQNGMYPGYTAWPKNASKEISGMSGITTPEGYELSNAEVYEIMWQTDMPFNTDVERLKRESRRKVNRFVLKTPGQIESIIDLQKLNQPYIYEEFAEDDGFIESFFSTEALSQDPDFNIKDFNGFLANRGHKNYLQEQLAKIENDNSDNALKARELLKLQGLNLYLNEQINRDLLQQKLMWEKANPTKDADTEGIQFYMSPKNFNPDFIKNWMKTETPYVYNHLEQNQLRLEKEYQNVLSSGGNVGAGEFLNKISSNAWVGFWHDFTTPLATYAMDVLPGEYTDEIAENWRRNTLINNFERGDQLRYAYKRGKILEFPEYGTTYLVSDDGRIFDDGNKIEATSFLTPQQRNNIVERTRKEGRTGSSFSSYGLAFESSRVIGDLFGQIALTRGIGKTKTALGKFTRGLGVLGPTKNFLKSLPVKSQVADAIIAQGTIGFVRGYEDTLLAARSAGLPDDESRELAANASVQTGFWYAITAPISPQTKAQNLLFGKPVKENIDVAVQTYMKQGWKGWNEFWKTQGQRFGTREGLKETGKGILRTGDMIQREGWKELFQENIQQAGETLAIGADINRQAGQQLLKSNYTLEDFIHTSALSFTAGAFMPGAGKIVNSSNQQIREFMGWDAVDRFNSLAYMAYHESDLKKLLASQIDQGLYTQEEADNLLGEVDQYRNTINHVPPNMSANAASTILGDIQQLNKLENDKKKAPKGFTGFDDEIQQLKDRINNTYYDELTKAQRKGIMAAARAGVAGKTIYKDFNSEEEALEYLKNTISKFDKEKGRDRTNQEFERYLKNRFFKGNSFGAMFTQDGTKYALEFKYNAAKSKGGKRMTQTAQHEFFHALINEVVSNDAEAGRLLGKALFNELGKLDLQLEDDLDQSVMPSDFKRRLKGYLTRFETIKDKVNRQVKNKIISKQKADQILEQKYSDTWEEAMNLYSEAIGDPDVDLKYDASAIEQIRNSWRRALQFVGARDIDLGSGKAVFNMLQDYNKSVKSGMLKYNRAFKKLGEKQGLTEEEKKKLKEEEKELDEKTLPKLKKKLDRQKEKQAEQTRKDLANIKANIKLAAGIADTRKKRKAAKKKAITTAVAAANIDKEESDLANKINDKFSLRVDKKLSPENFKENINNYYDRDVFSTKTGIDSVLYDIMQEYETVIEYRIESRYSSLPNIAKEDLLFETNFELIKHIRNFNKEFLKLRDKFKDQLAAKGLSKAEITKRVEAQDDKGYKNSKGELITENNDLNAWINSQLNNKIKQALKRPGITTEKFTNEIDERTLGEIDEESKVGEEKMKFEEDQEKLVELLSDPIFGFVDVNGDPIIIETLPLGDRAITLETIDDVDVTINRRIAAEEDPKIKKELEQQKRDLKRGLELEAIKGRTKAENDELKKLKDFEVYDLGSRGVLKTFKALSVPQKPVDMLIKEVENQILRAPNVETLQFYNFQNKLQKIIYPLLRKVTFQKGPFLDEFMYTHWKLLLDVINNPFDPVTGQATYAAKMMPESLKEFNEEGRRIKRKKVTRALFLQTYYGKTKATEIIKKYSKTPAKELKQLVSTEISPKTGREIGLTGVYDRRTALMELLSNVFVLQQARKSLRSQSFLNEIGKKNTNLYNQLKNDNIIADVLNDMASGKSSVVKFSLNNELSPFFKGRTVLQQFLMGSVMQDAQLNVQIKSKNHELKNSIKFSVPNLGNMKDEVIAFYLIDKFSKGYNNFEFRNIENSKGKLTNKLLEEGDVKFNSDFNFDEYSTDMSQAINQIIAEGEGIDPKKVFDNIEARNRGKKFGKYNNSWWLGPGDQDLKGLLWQLVRTKGKKADQQLDWLYDNILAPYTQGHLNIATARNKTNKDFVNLMNKYPAIKDRLKKEVPGFGSFTIDQAIRVYLWNKGKFQMPSKGQPGYINKKNMFELSNFVRKDPELRSFAEELSILTKQPNGYIEPQGDWFISTIQMDVADKLKIEQRKKWLKDYLYAVEMAFNADNLNKIEAVYGKVYREALEDMLYRTETMATTNKNMQLDNATKGFMHWIRGSVGVTMFFNSRSGLLQLVSTLNYINTSDNNPLSFGTAMANLPQLRKDVAYLWNSDYLQDRRTGMLNDLQEQEIQAIIFNNDSKNPIDIFHQATNWALKKGFFLTRIFDSIAIAFGGASFYRNRINTYIKDGFNEKEAEQKAYYDWFLITEETQQSGDPSKISMNQAGMMGRWMLAFQNTPLQYSRVMKRDIVDIINGRGKKLKNTDKWDTGTWNKLTKITYYGGIQYAIFSFLQNALFMKWFDDDEERWPTGKYDKQQQRFWHGWLDNYLRGGGLKLAYVAWAKNAALGMYNTYNDPKAPYKGQEVVLALTDGLIPLNIKLRKIFSAYQTVVWNKKESDWLIQQHGRFSLKNKYQLAAALQMIEGFTNAPLGRIHRKMENISNAMSSDYRILLRLMFLMGYSTWNLGLEQGNTRRGRSNELDFGPNIDFDKDLDLKPKIKF